jgi:hypothetical protein
VDKDGKARLRLFRTARAVGDQWLVLDGLAAGEQVVVAGAQGHSRWHDGTGEACAGTGREGLSRCCRVSSSIARYSPG